MKYLKRFNESESSITEEQIEQYFKENYTSEWFDNELNDRVYDYIDSEEAEEHDGDYVEVYKNLSTGGAVEYDILDEISKEASKHFNTPIDQKIDKRSILDIAHDHLIDTCTWYDKFVFNRRSTEPYKNIFGSSYDDLINNINW